jgi:stress response protein YsnF
VPVQVEARISGFLDAWPTQLRFSNAVVPVSKPRQDGVNETPDEHRIPLVEESLRIDKRVVETGRVRVRVVVDEQDHLFSEALDRSTVEVVRVPIDREIDVMPEPRIEGEYTIVPVVEEVLVVRRQLVLVEEVRIRRVMTTELVDRTAVARKMRAVIEREDLTDKQESD